MLAWRAAAVLILAALLCWYGVAVVVAQVPTDAGDAVANALTKLGAVLAVGAGVAALIELLK